MRSASAPASFSATRSAVVRSNSRPRASFWRTIGGNSDTDARARARCRTFGVPGAAFPDRMISRNSPTIGCGSNRSTSRSIMARKSADDFGEYVTPYSRAIGPASS
jgi:hypothetical protein